MLFEVKPAGFTLFKEPKFNSKVYLIEDSWNDWWEYKTLYSLMYVDDYGRVYDIGKVKIGQFNMELDKEKAVKPQLLETFNRLGPELFSLGQDVNYYARLNRLGEDVRYKILAGLNDVAMDKELFERALGEGVMGRSLLRSVSRTSVRGQFRRLAHGDASLTPYKFKFTTAENEMNIPLELSFEVKPESNPPTNLHILIGRNGVGKTHMLNSMIQSLLQIDEESKKYGSFHSKLESNVQELFANLVSVSFSAFDNTKPVPEREDNSIGIKYSYVGLQQMKSSSPSPDLSRESQEIYPKSTKMLGNEFKESLESITQGAKLPGG